MFCTGIASVRPAVLTTIWQQVLIRLLPKTNRITKGFSDGLDTHFEGEGFAGTYAT
jgi:hypothetical protein